MRPVVAAAFAQGLNCGRRWTPRAIWAVSDVGKGEPETVSRESVHAARDGFIKLRINMARTCVRFKAGRASAIAIKSPTR